MNKPVILKRLSGKEPQESGCCFRTCGGKPLIQQYNQKGTRTEKRLAKI